MRTRIPRATKVASSTNFNVEHVEVSGLLPGRPTQAFTPTQAHKCANKLITRWLERSRKEQREWKRKRLQMFRMIRYQMQDAQALAQAS